MGQRTADEAKATDFLRQRGYMASSAEHDEAAELSDALTRYQQRHRLPTSGAFDEATRLHLSLSRCSWVDEAEPRSRRLVIEADPSLARDALAALPWFLGPIPALGVDPAEVEGGVAMAFSMWEGVTPVQFPRRVQPGAARLIVSWAPIDGTRGILGQTRVGGPLQFDLAERWSVTDPPSPAANADVLTIALHEIGHAIGIGDIGDPNAVMHGFFGGANAVIRRGFISADFQAIARRFDT